MRRKLKVLEEGREKRRGGRWRTGKKGGNTNEMEVTGWNNKKRKKWFVERREEKRRRMRGWKARKRERKRRGKKAKGK